MSRIEYQGLATLSELINNIKYEFGEHKHSFTLKSGFKSDDSTEISSTVSSHDPVLVLGNSGVTAGTYGDSSNQTPTYEDTFKVPYIKVNEKGIVVLASEHTVKIPAKDSHVITVISGKKSDGTTDITATSASALNPSVTLGNSGATAGAYGDTSNQTPTYGGTFNVPFIRINEKGIVTEISSHTVKIPGSDQSDTWRQIKVNGVDMLKESISTKPLDFTDGEGIDISGVSSTGLLTIGLQPNVITPTSKGPSANKSGLEAIDVPYVTVDTYGRVTGLSSKTYTGKNRPIKVDGTLKLADNTSTALDLKGTSGNIVLSESSGAVTFNLASGIVSAGTKGATANVTGTDTNTIKVPKVTVDTYGRVTGLSEYTYTSVDSTYSFEGIANGIKVTKTTNGSSSVLGNYEVSSISASKITGVLSIDNIPRTAIERVEVVVDDNARFALTTDDVQNGDTVKVTGTKKMYIVKDATKLNTEAGYEEYFTSTDWSVVTNKTTGTVGSASGWSAGTLPTLGTAIKVNSKKTWSAGTLPTLGTAIGVGSASGWSAGTLPTLGTAIPADDITAWSAGTLPTLGDNITVKSVKSWSAGSTPTLGTAISADDITAWSAGTLPTLGTAIPADDITAWSAGSLPTLGDDIVVKSVKSWSAGSTPTLGTAISADDITAWSAGTLPTLGTNIAVASVKSWSAGSAPTLGTAISADDITAWSAGSLPTLGTNISADDITAWDAGSTTTVTYDATNHRIKVTNGTAPNLSYTTRSIPNVTGVGSLPSLSYTARSIPNVTSVGSVPSLTTEDKSIPNVTGVGTLPSLTYTARSIPNVTGVGSVPSLTTEDIEIPNVTGVGSLPSLTYTAKSIPNVTGVGTLPNLTYTARSIPNVTGVGSVPSLTTEDIEIPNVTGVGTLPSLSYTAKSIPNVTGVGTLPSLTISNKSIPNVTGVGTLPSLTTEEVTIPNVTGVGTLPSLTITTKTFVTTGE